MWTTRPLLLLALALVGVSLARSISNTTDKLTVKAITGVFKGVVDPEYPAVRQFRSIPYAEPPLGKRRWMPPVPASPSLQRSHANRFPPPCPQYLSKNLTTWNSNITNFSIRLQGQSRISGSMAQTSSEDCLYLAVWTPLNATRESNLPVALFIPGGSFTSGGVDVPYQQPTPWVQRSQRHIFVAANYRVNIAGFPWAAGLEDQNVGLLDARAALEWVYANIPAFGGDSSRITLWGHSAGGVAVDMLAHAYPSNPLAAGLIMQSGTAMVNVSHPDPNYRDFTFVAKNLGCDFPNAPLDEIFCMRQVPMSLIQNFIGQYRDNGTTTPTAPSFKPLPDDKTVFFNYTLRAAQPGGLARIPALVSTTSNEQASLTKYPVENVVAGPNQTRVDAETVGVFVCLASNTTRSRAEAGLKTWRYEYAGNFSSLTPLAWMGAYHGSDVPMVFGTFEALGDGGVTGFQDEVAARMQEDVLAFMEDAHGGLRRRGWLAWGDTEGSEVAGGRTMMRFASGGVVARNVSADEVDDACVLGARYNSSP